MSAMIRSVAPGFRATPRAVFERLSGPAIICANIHLAGLILIRELPDDDPFKTLSSHQLGSAPEFW